MNTVNVLNALTFAQKLVRNVGKYIESSKATVRIVKDKGSLHICTNVDLEAEQIFIDAIKLTYPDHTICSEEAGLIKNKSKYIWYIDPIDGTTGYYRNIPLYRTTLSLESDSHILLGCSYYPYLDRLYSCTYNGKSYRNADIIYTNAQKDINQALVYSYMPNKKLPSKIDTSIWRVLKSLEHEIFRFRGDSNVLNGLNWLAQGSIEGVISLYSSHCFNWYDISSGLILVERAGGKITNMHGDPIKNRDLTKGVIASNGHIHDQLLHIIQKSLQSRT